MSDQPLLQRITQLENELERLKKINEALMNRVEFSTDRNSSAYNLFEANLLSRRIIKEQTSHLVKINSMLQQEILERKASELSLKLETSFSSAVFNSANIWIIVFDKNLNVVKINQTCEKATGFINEDVIGMNLRELFFENTAAFESDKNSSTITSPARHPTLGTLSPWYLKNGDKRFIAWSTSTISDLNGNTEYIISCGLDVTELQDAEISPDT